MYSIQYAFLEVVIELKLFISDIDYVVATFPLAMIIYYCFFVYISGSLPPLVSATFTLLHIIYFIILAVHNIYSNLYYIQCTYIYATTKTAIYTRVCPTPSV